MAGRTPPPRVKRRHSIAQAFASLALAPIMLSVPLAAVVGLNASVVQYAASLVA
jgi:hypothetical protein